MLEPNLGRTGRVIALTDHLSKSWNYRIIYVLPWPLMWMIEMPHDPSVPPVFVSSDRRSKVIGIHSPLAPNIKLLLHQCSRSLWHQSEGIPTEVDGWSLT